jgi:hypothetical protein
LARATTCIAKLALGALLGLWLLGPSAPVNAAPAFFPGLDAERASRASLVEQIKIFQRGRPPIYPYYYKQGRPGGWDFYLGFVPYAKGDYGTQAVQRSQYPQDIAWPESMRFYGPVPSGRAYRKAPRR